MYLATFNDHFEVGVPLLSVSCCPAVEFGSWEKF